VRIDVLLGEAPVAAADVADRVVIVIDVLRAATTAAMALQNGARALLPFETVEAAAQAAKAMDPSTVRLGGERHMVRIPGFDFGNSPLEYTSERVSGRTIVFTTTNGTLALAATHRARTCLFASFVNAGATIDAACAAVTSEATSMTIVCAGADRHLALEDAVCAGRLARGIASQFPDVVLGDGARVAEMIERPYRENLAALAHDAAHARALSEAGFADDVSCCLTIDSAPVAVAYRERQLRAVGASAR